MKKYIPIFSIFLFCSTLLFGQNVPMEFRHLNKNQGLDQPFPYSIIQDKAGFIWIGGENGLWRYSGSQFKHFHHSVKDSNSLAYDFVWTLFEDSHGNIWAGTYGGGLSKFNPKNNQFTNYAHKKSDSSTLSDNKVRGIAEDDKGNLWIGTNKGLNKLNTATGTFSQYGLKDGLSDLVVRTIKLSFDKKKLFICTGNGLNIFDLETETFDYIGKSQGLRYSYLYDVLQTKENELWVASGGGVEIINLTSMNIKHVSNDPTNGDGLSHYVTFSIYQNPENPNKIWFGTMNGINYYDINQKRFYWIEAFQKNQDNIGGNNIYSIYEDKMGGIWAAVNNGGIYHSHPSLSKFNYKNFLPKETDKYLNRYTSFIRHSKDEVLITSYSGLIVWNEKNKQYRKFQMTEGDPTSVNRMSQIKKWKEDEYLISTWGNFIYHWDHKNKVLKQLRYKSDNDEYDFNLRLYVDSQERIWIGNSLGGLKLYDIEKEEISSFSVSDLSNPENSGDEYVKYIKEDHRKNLWVGTADGLHLFNKKNNSFIKFEPSKEIGHLSNGNINHISLSKDEGLWISTELGLNFFNFKDSTFTRYFKQDGLPSNVISSTLEDNSGNVWVATASGLSRMSPNGKFSNYDQTDGLREEYFIFGAAYKDQNGQLYFGTSREYIHFNPDEIKYNELAPIVYFDQLKINDQVIKARENSNKLKKPIAQSPSITLGPQDYLVNISYDALNLINGQKNRYSLIMEGLDEAWRPASTDKSITFSNLKPGNYTLRLKAINDENIWSKEQATLSLKVLPYWYKSLWFRVLFSISIFMIVGLVLRWRFNQIQQINKKLEKLVGSRTEEVMAQKEEIESQNEKLHSRNTRIELLLKELNHRIKNNLQLISSILNLHSRSTDNIDAKMALTEGKLRMQALSILHQKLYMTESYTEVHCKEYIQELIEYLSIAFKSNYSKVKFNLELDDFKLNLDQAVPLGLVLNELVTNSLKHSGKDELIIDFIVKKEHDSIKINLKDNGRGISKKQFDTSTSFGINIIKSLIDQLDGHIDVECIDGTHFKIEFTNKEPT